MAEFAEHLVPLLALTAMEIVLGIDNIVFISILTSRLPAKQQKSGRNIGLALALGTRLLLLFALAFVMSPDSAVFNKSIFKLSSLGIPVESMSRGFESLSEANSHGLEGGSDENHKDAAHLDEIDQITLRDLVLLIGGAFLIGKSVHEIHNKLDDASGHAEGNGKIVTFGGVLFQIALLDVVFSLDSVITAVGIVSELWVIVIAMIISMVVMLAAAGPISVFIERHPTLKILALSFLILIGVMLVAEGFAAHFNKGYIYFAMAFSLVVEAINIRLRAKRKPQVEASA
ncbi:MAG: TerC family protein [Pirellulaceae bacterium]|jgi:predicted tellurium resistance membrane protein TerC|nr:TerC family protein [Pirellulaceae bacterium]